MALDLGSALYAWIKTQASVTGIIGTGDACQFYPVAVLEQKTPPLIVYQEEKDEAYTTHNELPSLGSSRVSFACIAVDTTGATALAEALRVALLSFAGGLMGTLPVAKVQYKGSSPAYQWEEQQFAVDATFKFYYSLA